MNIGLERINPDLVTAYNRFGLQRASQGEEGLDWTFGADPSGIPPFCVARNDDRILGLAANIPQRIKLDEVEGSAFQAVDSFVSEEARGMGLFSKLAGGFADAAQEQGADVHWGFPNANAAPAWFGRLGWQDFGEVPFLIKPLNASYFLRKLKLPGGMRLSRGKSVKAELLNEFSSEVDAIWSGFSKGVRCAVVRDASALNHRVFGAPHSSEYRVVKYGTGKDAALVVSRIMEKHGGKIAYILEAMGGKALAPLLKSELGALAQAGAEVALAWCFPHSPNYGSYKSSGFFSLPERFRPAKIYFGARALSPAGAAALGRHGWYLSYLDSDGV